MEFHLSLSVDENGTSSQVRLQCSQSVDASNTETFGLTRRKMPGDEILPENVGRTQQHAPQSPVYLLPTWARCCVDCCYVPRRYIIVFLTSLGMLFAHAMRVNVGVTIVALIRDDLPSVPVTGGQEDTFSLNWSTSIIGFLHSSFYIGYLITQIPGGYLCQILPSHRLFGCGILMSSCLNLFVPAAIEHAGFTITCVVRGFQGLCEGVIYPSSYALLRHWTTPEERSRMGALVLTGVYTGPILGMATSGQITHFAGWTFVFYFSGLCGIAWFMLWLFLAYETPSRHLYISNEELKYIHQCQGETAIIYEHDSVPWRSIFTSLPVMSLNVCNFARSFIFFFLLTNEPLFLSVFGFSLAENGLLSSLPHVLLATCAAISGPFADLLINLTPLSVTAVRKLFTCGGFGIEGACLLALGFLYNGVPVLVLLVIGVGLSGFTISGWQINHLDLAPRYASVLVGITTFVGTIAGIVNPIVVGYLTPNQTIDEWHQVFYLISAILFFAVFFYLIFGTGEKQRWSEPSPLPSMIKTESSPFTNTKFSAHFAQYGSDATTPALGNTEKDSSLSPTLKE